MFIKRNSVEKNVSELGCFSCFGFGSFGKARKGRRTFRSLGNSSAATSEEDDEGSHDGDVTVLGRRMRMNFGVKVNRQEDENEFRSKGKPAEEILKARNLNGMICRDIPVKETHELIRSEDEDGNRMINQYVRERKIGSGSYGKVVLYRNLEDGKHYAIKAFHKSHLLKQRVAPSETAMSDVLREVMIMKMLSHPNTVNLVEVIDDPTMDHFYMVLDYVEGKWVCEGACPAGDLGEHKARKYLRDIVRGLMYLHAHNIIHGDIKPDNLLVTASGTVKIGDFSVSQVFEDDNDELRRSPGTPVFTAPECCLGLTYRGRAADTWAVGVTLYCMLFGNYPFLGDTLQDTYDKIVHNSLHLPDDLNPSLKDLVEGLLCKDPAQRMTLEAVAEHPWFVSEEGPLLHYPCWCKRDRSLSEVSESRDTQS